MRKIYAQAGIGIRKLATVEQALPVTWANFNEAEQIKVGNMFDNTNGAINLFYARSLAGITANGISQITFPERPDGLPGPGPAPTGMRDLWGAFRRGWAIPLERT